MSVNVAADSMARTSISGIVSGLSKEEVKMLDKDIRFIKLGRPALRTTAAPLMLSGTYFLVVALLVVMFIVAYFTLRQRIRNSKNTVLVRNRRANKVAVQRFRAAEKFMKHLKIAAIAMQRWMRWIPCSPPIPFLKSIPAPSPAVIEPPPIPPQHCCSI